MDRHERRVVNDTERKMLSTNKDRCPRCHGTGFLDVAMQRVCPICLGVPYPKSKKKRDYDVNKYKRKL
jgi:hypothetical protein